MWWSIMLVVLLSVLVVELIFTVRDDDDYK